MRGMRDNAMSSPLKKNQIYDMASYLIYETVLSNINTMQAK